VINTHLVEVAKAEPMNRGRLPLWEGWVELDAVDSVAAQCFLEDTQRQGDEQDVTLVRSSISVGARVRRHYLNTCAPYTHTTNDRHISTIRKQEEIN